jgi:hypothetical protein
MKPPNSILQMPVPDPIEVVGLTHPELGQAINPCKCRLKED